MTPFESFQLYHGLKLHFTTKKYDFIKFRGKTNVKASSFDKRNDRFFFHKLYERYKKDLKEFYISVFSSGEDVSWVGDLLDERYHQIYLDRRKRLESFKKYFGDDVKLITEYMEDQEKTFKQLLAPRAGKLPILIHLYLDELISLETLVVINRLTKLTEKVELDHPLWDDAKLLLTKYQPFVKVSELGEFSKMLREGIEKGEMPL